METALERLLQHYWPGVSNSQLVELLDKRIDRTTIANWRSGHRKMPHWAIARLNQQIEAFERFGHALATKLSPGPTRRVNALHLKRWHANKNRPVINRTAEHS